MSMHTKYVNALFLALVMLNFGCSSALQNNATADRLDDVTINAKAKTAILSEPSLPASNVNVETYRGVVQLSGSVQSQQEKEAFTHVVRSVPEVKDVSNDIRMK